MGLTLDWYGDPQNVLGVLQGERRERGWLPNLPEFEILRELGRGGQGIVFLAVRKSTQRPVAIKVLLDGIYASAVRRQRFERELEIIAQLHHPHIVRVHGGGITPDGRPYLTMEYVDGAPLEHWLARRGGPPASPADLANVTRLFSRICEAVNHAHLRGVIHRDLKPGNVLIDANDEPHVLDFGLARASDNPDRLTETGQFFGSLPWTSPEQVRGDRGAVDLRSDVYALGVMLYQSLTGTAPYDVSGGMQQATHNIAFAEPQRPRLLNRAIDDDLQAIVLHALEKSPSRRYQSAGEMAADLRAHLEGRPVEARSDSGWYLIRKAVRRFRLPIGIAIVFLALTITYAITLSMLYRDNDRARARAEAALARTDKVNSFLNEILSRVDPSQSGYKVTMAEVLDRAEVEARRRFANEPEIDATVALQMAHSFVALGEYTRGAEAAERAFNLRCKLYGEHNSATLDALEAQSEALAPDFCDEKKRLDVARRLLSLSLQEDPRSPRSLKARLSVIEVESAAQEFNTIGRRMQELDELATEIVAPGDITATVIRLNYIFALQAQARYGQAESLARKLLAELEQGPDPENQYLLALKLHFGRMLIDTGRAAEAEPLVRGAYGIIRRILGPYHPAAITDSEDYVRLLLALGDCREALDFAKRQYEEISEQYPPTDGRILRARNVLEIVHSDLGQSVSDYQPGETVN